MANFDYPDSSVPSGYICSGCGMWVNGGDYHICSAYNQQNVIIQRLDSVIDRLDRINENLEKIIEQMK